MINLAMMSCVMQGATPEKIVETAKNCSFKAIDWVTFYNVSPHYLKKLSEDAGLLPFAHTHLPVDFMQGKKGAIDACKAALEGAAILGVDLMMIPPFPRQLGESREEDKKAWYLYFEKVLPLAQEMGIRLTVESTGTLDAPIDTKEEILELLHTFPDLRLTFDIGNMAASDDMASAYSFLREKVIHFHCKDFKVSNTPLTPKSTLRRNGKYFTNEVIGKGDLDLQGFWQKVPMEDKKYFVNVETLDFSGKSSTPEVLKEVADLMRSW